MSEKSVNLSEIFYINSKKKNNVKIQVKLSAEGVHLRRETTNDGNITEQLLRIEDIFGSRCGPRLKKRTRGGLISCRCQPEEQEHAHAKDGGGDGQKDNSAYLYIYAYVKHEQPLRRQRTVRILRFRSYSKYEENLKLAERWHQAINLNRSIASPMAFAMDGGGDGVPDRRELLILLNPKSGAGKGREMFQRQVVPVLQEASLQYELHVTKYANFAREFVRTKQDLATRYRGIVVAAGDGLFYEVLNGLMEREDWQRVTRQLPLGIIPCGSGNGLAKSISHLYDEPYEPQPIVQASLTCASGHTAPMDVVRVEIAPKRGKHCVMYSFLSIGWGIIADVDIQSEHLRVLGTSRFTLWSVRRVLRLRTYKGRLYYLPWQQPPPAQQPVKSSSSFSERHAKTKRSSLQFKDVQDDDNEEQYHDDEENEFTDVISLDRCSSRANIDSWHSAASRRTAYYSLAGQSMRSQRSILSSKLATALEKVSLESPPAPTPTIPPLAMPLNTDQWCCMEGDFVMVHAAYTTHIASDCYFVPPSRLNDGIIYLIIIRAGVSRSTVAQFLLSMSSGTHLPEKNTEHIQILPVSAFRIEPASDSDGIMTVDGELIDYGPIQGEIFPGLIRVMVPK